MLLTDLELGGPGLRRLAHGYATSGTWRRLLRRAGTAGWEVLAALPRDAVTLLRGRGKNLIRIEPGIDPQPDALCLAIYVHYAPSGQISAMVRRQLLLLRQAGFAVVFASMAPGVPQDDWEAAREVCALVVQRRNFGLDFGAWRDLVPELRRRWPPPEELMLANDSVLGPIRPLQPVIEALRAGGEGFFGLTESLQGGPHLQSYMLLAKGRSAASDLLGFLDGLYVSHSKWLLVQLSEIRLARWMRGRGHRVAALFGYDRVVRAALADPEERRRLAASHTRLRDLETLGPAAAEGLLHEWPLNPTQHLWHVLVTKLDAPFLKTELVRRNPGRLPDVESWPTVVPADSPCPLPMLKDHLAVIGPG
jgi:hypothetical protein